MQINQANLTELYKNFRVTYLEAYQAGKPFWEQLAMRVPSMSQSEVHAWLGSIPGMKELVDEITIENLTAHRYTIENKEWHDTIAVKQAHVEMDTYGIYTPLFQALGSTARQHPDELVASIMIHGFDAANTCYTGRPFFATNHKPQADGLTFSNKGTKKLSAQNFETARANIKGRLNAKGRPMNLGNKLQLVVSPANESLGRSILQGDFIQAVVKNVAGNENVGTTAVTNTNKGTAELIVWSQLAGSPDMWFLLETGMPVKPFLVQFNKEPVLTALTNPDSDHVFKKHEFLYQAYGRYAAGYGMPEMAYGSTGVDAA